MQKVNTFQALVRVRTSGSSLLLAHKGKSAHDLSHQTYECLARMHCNLSKKVHATQVRGLKKKT